MKNIKLYLIAFLLFVIVKNSRAQNGLLPKTVYMYKNGYAWFLNSGTVKLDKGKWQINETELPYAIKGSFWFESPAGINYILRTNDTVLKTVFQPGLEELFRININKSVKLLISAGTSTINLEGTIVKVFYTPDDSMRFYQSNPAVAVIRTAQSDVVLNRDNMGRIIYSEFGTGAVYDYRKKAISGNLTVYCKEKPGSTELNMAYLASHPAWDPVYRLVLDKNGKSYLTLGAEISSGSQDLKNAEINLVVGDPSFSWGGMLSRLVNNSYVSPAPAYDGGSRYEDAEYMPAEKAIAAKRDEAASPVSVNAGQSADFYLYNIKNFSMQRNQSAYVQILNEKIDVEHKYECQLPAASMYGYSYYQNLNDAPIQPAYHYLKFNNPVKQNLAPAAVFVENGENGKDIALGQPMMDMVPVGGTAKILLAQNPDLPVKMMEEETSRVPNAFSINNRNETLNFDLVTMKSTVRVENQGIKELTLNLKRVVEGKTLTSELPWTFATQKPASGSPNSTNSINWDIKLKPGEKKEFTFTYQYYLRVY